MDCRVDYSTNTFRAVVNLCKDLGIRHPEELSLCKPLEPAHLKKNFSTFPKQKFAPNEYEIGRNDFISPAPDTNSFIPTHSTLLHSSNGSLDSPSNGPFSCAPYPNTHTTVHQRNNHPISSPTGVRITFTLNPKNYVLNRFVCFLKSRFYCILICLLLFFFVSLCIFRRGSTTILMVTPHLMILHHRWAILLKI